MDNSKKITISYPLLGMLLILCFLSCLAIKSSAPLINKIANPEDLWMKQLAFYGISFILMFIVYKIGNERIYRLIWLAYGILVIFLIGLVIERFSLIFLGRGIVPYVRSVNGATRWYSFPGFDFQPSEFMKIVLILCVSNVIYDHNNTYPVHRFNSDCIMLAKVLLVTIPPCILIFLQNDAGFTSLILVSVIFILFASGLQMRWFVVGGIILAIGLLILSYLFIFNHDVFVRLIGSTYRVNRFYGWIDPEGTYNRQGYQLFNALMGFGSGGLFGHGFQSNVISLPEAQTDFIFAVIAQDYGFVGGFITIVIIVIFDALLLHIGLRSTSDRDKYFVAGIFGLLIFQQTWNIGMVMGVVPITGITLPFISYGGSSLLSYMISMAIFFDIDKKNKITSSKGHFKTL